MCRGTFKQFSFARPFILLHLCRYSLPVAAKCLHELSIISVARYVVLIVHNFFAFKKFINVAVKSTIERNENYVYLISYVSVYIYQCQIHKVVVEKFQMWDETLHLPNYGMALHEIIIGRFSLLCIVAMIASISCAHFTNLGLLNLQVV